jgi:hypothetical protein
MTLQGVNSPLSGNANIDGFIWQEHPTYAKEIPFKNYINYSFDTDLIPDATARDGSHLMTDAQKAGVRAALSYVSSVTGITFNEVPNGTSANTDLVFGTKEMGSTSPASGMDSYTYNFTAGASPTLDFTDSILLNSQRADLADTSPGTLGYQTLLEEIGHALGLKNPTFPPIAVPYMSTNSSFSVLTSLNDPIQSTYTAGDLQALNWLYGGKGLVNTNQVPFGGNASGTITLVDQHSQSGVFTIYS